MIKANVDKVWEKSGEQGFVLALTLRHISLKRAFLSLSRYENKVSITLQENKPQNLRAHESAAQQILRKYLKGAELLGIWFSASENNVQLLWQKKQLDTKWRANLSLDAHTGIWDFSVEGLGSLLRMTPDALFTKRKQGEQFDPQIFAPNEKDGFCDLLPQKLAALEERINKQPNLNSHLNESLEEKASSSPQNWNKNEENHLDHVMVNTFLRKIRRRIRTLKKTLLNLQQTLDKHHSYENFLSHGEALKKYAHLWQPGQSEITIFEPNEPPKNSKKYIIPLNKDLSLGEQVEYFYSQGNKAKRGIIEHSKRLVSCEREIQSLQIAVQALASTPGQDLIINLMTQYSWLTQNQNAEITKKGKTKTPEHKPYWLFVPKDLKIKIIVGKTAQDNDLITKNARSHDLWFHAMQTTGSHVIVPGSLFNRLTPAEQTRTLRYASILSIHYSSLKNNRAGEIYKTVKTHLKKKKGMPPGKWLIEKADTLKIQYTGEELDVLLKDKVNESVL